MWNFCEKLFVIVVRTCRNRERLFNYKDINDSCSLFPVCWIGLAFTLLQWSNGCRLVTGLGGRTPMVEIQQRYSIEYTEIALFVCSGWWGFCTDVSPPANCISSCRYVEIEISVSGWYRPQPECEYKYKLNIDFNNQSKIQTINCNLLFAVLVLFIFCIIRSLLMPKANKIIILFYYILFLDLHLFISTISFLV